MNAQDFDIDELPSLTFLNGTGDVTIVWDESNRQAVKEMIALKMAQGFSFFKVRTPGQRGRAAKIKSPYDLDGLNSVNVSDEVNGTHLHDEDLAKLFEAGQIIIAPRSGFGDNKQYGSDREPLERLKDPEKILNSKTIVTQPLSGG